MRRIWVVESTWRSGGDWGATKDVSLNKKDAERMRHLNKKFEDINTQFRVVCYVPKENSVVRYSPWEATK